MADESRSSDSQPDNELPTWSPSVSGVSTPTSSAATPLPVPGPARSQYGNLSYAPRQSSFRNSPSSGASPALTPKGSTISSSTPFKATQSGFVSHSTLLANQQQSQPSTSQPEPPTTTSPSILDDCEKLGLGTSSPGYLLVKKLIESNDPEWRELAQFLTSGQATLLLPAAFKSSSKSSNNPDHEDLSKPITLAFAQDHILFHTTTRNSSDSANRGHVTLSGLRCTVEDSTSQEGPSNQSRIVVKSFISRNDRTWPAELRNPDWRRNLMATQSPLPQPSCSDYPYPNYPLLSQTHLVFPDLPPLSANRTRTASGAANASSLSSPSHRPSSSTSFVSLFGGGARDKRKAPPSTSSDLSSGASELLSVGHTGTSASASAVAQPQSGTSTLAPNDAAPKVPVWLIDRPMRRSRALRGMVHSVQARLIRQLEREAHIPQDIAEVVASFAGAFYPPVDSLSSSTDSFRSSRSQPSSASHPSSPNSPRPVPSPIYAAPPEEVAASFQDVYTSVYEQLQQQAADDGQDHQPKLTQQMELVEKLLTQETYDRIFSPAHSTDVSADKNLSTRIAALNLLGLDWGGLGLDLPPSEDAQGDGSSPIRTGLDKIIEQCSVVLQQLQSRNCQAPAAKLDALVSVHQIIVEGLEQLPRISLKAVGEEQVKQDDARIVGTSTDSDAEPQPSASSSTNTSSADLILPILIRLLISANPQSLASHLLYIQRYRSERFLSTGEAAYCLINFQAAVQFIENAKPAELGLDEGALSVMVQEDSVATEKSAAIEMLKHVHQEQTGPAADLPVGGRMRGLTGVVNSSFSVLGRVIGSGASAGMEAWDRGSKNIEGARTLEDIRSLLGGSMAKSATTTKEFVNMIREKEREGNGDEPSSPSKTFSTAVRKRASSIRSIGSARSVASGPPPGPSQATDYSNASEQERDLAAAFDLSAPTKADSSKPSIGDRLANLNWKFGMTSPTVPTKELPSTDSQSSQRADRPLQSPSLLLPPHELQQPASQSQVSPTTPKTPGSASPFASYRELPGPPTPNKRLGEPGLPLRSPVGMHSSPASGLPVSLPASLQSPYAPLSQPPSADRPLHVVLASSGSVASIKVPLIAERLLEHANVRVQVIATRSSLHFYDKARVAALDESSASTSVYTVASLAQENLHASREATAQKQDSLPRAHLWTDEDEWSTWKKVGDPILHIELRRWADVVLVAPCSANTLAKISGGICDNLLVSMVVLCWM